MPRSLMIDTAGGANFEGFSLRNVGRLHVGGAGLPTEGFVFEVTGASRFGDVTFTGVITGAPFAAASHTHGFADLTGVASDVHTHSYGSLTGIPATFAPSAHTHPASDISAGTFPGLVVAGLGLGIAGGASAVGTLFYDATVTGMTLRCRAGGSTEFSLRAEDDTSILRAGLGPAYTISIDTELALAAISTTPISAGANDSAGAGFRQLRVPN